MKKFLLLAMLLAVGLSLYAQSWEEALKIVASDRAADDWFGWSVSISGDYAVVGAYHEDEDAAGGDTATNAGSAYIFRREGTSWVQEAKITASDRTKYDNFGYSVSISGDYVLVGAYTEDHDAAGENLASAAGSAYIFRREGTSWDQQAKIVASDRAESDYFGCSVSISGDYAVVGAFGKDAAAGSAYIFKREGTSWDQQAKIVASDKAGNDRFGYSVSISGDYVLVGAYYEDEDAAGGNTATNAGSAYIFRREETSWIQEAKIVASDRTGYDYFGYSVSISGDYVLVGAYTEDHDAAGGFPTANAGSAYIFRREGTSWVQEAKIVASDRAADDEFGRSVSISGNYAIVGAHAEDHDAAGENLASAAGSAYIFRREGISWDQQAKIVALDRQPFDEFGISVSISGDYAVIGAYGEDHDADFGNAVTNAGSAYIFVYTENTPPDSFDLIYPLADSQVPTLSPTLLWHSAFDSDPDDIITYTLCLDTPEPGIKEYNTSTDTLYSLTGLTDNTTYYWKVVATDLSGATSENTGGYQSFTVNMGNDYPTVPSISSPDSVIVLSLKPEFRWKASTDPDPGDIISYKMYVRNDIFSDSKETDSVECVLLNPLVDNSEYSWYVKAMDNHLAYLYWFSGKWSFVNLPVRSDSSFFQQPDRV